MSTNCQTMTDAEFKAYWDAQYAQLARVNRRTWFYVLLLTACGVAVLQGMLFLAGVSVSTGLPVWPFLWMFLLIGILTAKVGRALAWRREGGKPAYLRRRGVTR